jgi:hydrogenase maturation factor
VSAAQQDTRVWLDLEPMPTCDVREGCITCGDVAVVLSVTELRGADALCHDDEDRTELVATELVGTVQVGDRLLVHAGVALELLPAAAPDRQENDQEEQS